VTALAILDDLGAVLIIAVVYTAHLSGPMLAGAALAFAALLALNRAGVERLWPYLAIGAVLWAFVLRSGVHATVAGVAVALTIPLRSSPGRPEEADSPLHILEHAIQPWAAFFILPVFGFVNAGVSFADLAPSELVAPVTLGVALGLLVGKQIGVFAAAYGAIRLRLVAMPAHASVGQLYGVALLCGIGFTMSLFIGQLAFPGSPDLMEEVKVGVLAGSLASALAGWLVLRRLDRRRRPVTPASP
jgi:NhaA family Na+:H+ antiporter